VELLRGLQERGDLLRDADGLWTEGATLDWESLPARVEAAIAERIERLPGQEQELLSVASVEGEEFHAEVAARVLGLPNAQALAALSGPLGRRHHLVTAQSLHQAGEQVFSRFRFQHHLFQRYLYQRLDPIQRAHLHGEIAQALEALGASPTGAPDPLNSFEMLADNSSDLFTSPRAVASEATLAWHWEESGLTEKAILWHCHAARKAIWLAFVHAEELRHTRKILDLAGTLPEGPRRTRWENLGHLFLGLVLVGEGGWAAPGVQEALHKSLQRAEQLGDRLALSAVLTTLAQCMRMRASLDEALSYIQRAVGLEDAVPPGWLVQMHGELALIRLYRGEFAPSVELLSPLFDDVRSGRAHHTWVTIDHLNQAEHLAWALWCQGYPDQALAVSQELLDLVLREKAWFEPGTPMVLCGATCFVHQLRREVSGVEQGLQMLRPLLESSLVGAFWRPVATFYQAWVHTLTGLSEQGIAELRSSLVELSRMAVAEIPYLHGYLVQALGAAGLPEEGLALVEEMLAQVERTGERWSEAELHRLKGELLRRGEGETRGLGDEEGAEDCFRRAIDVAQRQEARSWELRATTSLARLLQAQGRGAEAREMLAAIYHWFTEGFDTLDLLEAGALLDELQDPALMNAARPSPEA